MSVTLSIIREVLNPLHTETHTPSNWNPSFEFCLPLPETEASLEKNCLYVGRLSTAMKIQNKKDLVIICLRDRLHDDSESGSIIENLLIVNENISRDQLLFLVQNRFYSILDWEKRLNEALIQGCSMQDLVDLCPPFLENHIQITDASFMKLAQSSNIKCDDPICIALEQYGYHPEETVEKFRSHHLFDVWARREDIYLDNETVVAKYPTLHKIFKYHGNYFAHVVMTCNIAKPCQAMIDLFRIFIDAMTVCVERNWETKMACLHPYDTVFEELLNEQIKDPAELKNRAQRTDLPIDGHFYLIQIVRAKDQTVPFGTMMKEFSERFPRFRFINYNESIVAFIHSSSVSDPKDFLNGMEDYLEKYDSYCGLSSHFTDLIQTRIHFDQAQIALQQAAVIKNSSSPIKLPKSVYDYTSRICPFDIYFPFSFLSNTAEELSIWRNSNYYRNLYKLYKNDIQRGTDDLQLLYVYLTHERRSTEAAALLNMHRNSIIYRINRIEEFLDIDLNCEYTRLMLTLAFLPVIAYGFE